MSTVVWGIAIGGGIVIGRDSIRIFSLTLLIPGAILAVFLNIAIGTVHIMLFWNRSNKINTLHDESDFTLLKIAVILIRLFGEVTFIVSIGIGFLALIASIFGIDIPSFFNFFYFPSGLEISIGTVTVIVFLIYG